MPLLDDDVLGALLHELGDSYALPESGARDVLDRAEKRDDQSAGGWPADDEVADDGEVAGGSRRPAAGRVGGMFRTHPLLSVAASVVVLALVLAGGITFFGGRTFAPGGRSAVKASLQAPPTGTRHPPASSPTTTTVLSGGAASAGTAFSATAPTPAHGALGAPSGATGAASAPQSKTVTGTANGDVLPAGAVGQPAKIEQTGSLTLTVPKGGFSDAMTKLSTLATTYGGFVANSQTQARTAGNPPSGTVTLQIPVGNFGAVLKAAEALGTPSALNTKATDVTGQYVDLQSRITALQASRQQYLTIMTKASSVGDVLAVQAQLDGLQSQIEQLQGQLAVLDSETSYSTMIFAVQEAAPHHHHHVVAPAESGAAKAWHDSVHGFASGVDGIIRIAGPTLFALLCLAVLVLGGRVTWRRLQRHNL
jgi:Domain of unknown function (DUF4349)